MNYGVQKAVRDAPSRSALIGLAGDVLEVKMWLQERRRVVRGTDGPAVAAWVDELVDLHEQLLLAVSDDENV